MGDFEGSRSNFPLLQNLAQGDYFWVGKGYGLYGIVGAIVLALIIPLLLSMVIMGKKKAKQRAVPVEVGGETGITMRHSRFTNLVEVPWEGATTIAAMFEQSCKKHAQDRFLGSRKFISKEEITASDGRKFEKLHLGEYQWETYAEAFDRACNFASGLIKLGHCNDSPAAIFAETQAEWLLAFQVAHHAELYNVIFF